jgi:hypothetical protein
MKAALTQIVQRLCSRKDRLQQHEQHKSQGGQLAANKTDNDRQRCLSILNYWLDVELFDLPECPVYNKKDVLSVPADDFITTLKSLESQCDAGKLKITKESRLLVMFQCHRAGYINEQDEQHPNYEIPRTYLVAQALVPFWSETQKRLLLQRSEDDADLIVNLAAMRTLYRKCKPESAHNMSLSDWVEARLETIENLLELELQADDETQVTAELLCEQLKNINRKLANEFWPEPGSKTFMLEKCQALESQYQKDAANRLEDEKKYDPVTTKSGEVTFRWRFCFYPEGSEKSQLGPFFVKDLEHCIEHARKHGVAGLSRPLQRYLLGEQQQVEIKQAANNGVFFHSKTNKPVFGRWPEDPKHGLSLLQSVAVNITLDLENNPLVAVNGPPGTGKTTLLKDIIASHFVQRTLKLSRCISDENWLDKPAVIDAVMQHSMVVASSNNKAVENISKELPASNKIFADYRALTAHFKNVSAPDSWGIFCAVLGNADNRKAFKSLLKTLGSHLKKVGDYFELNSFNSKLEKIPKNEVQALIQQYCQSLAEKSKLASLAHDILETHAAKKHHKNFLEPFAHALLKIENGALSIDSVASTWATFNEEQWLEAKAAILAFKKQWFAAKKYELYAKAKLDKALKHFTHLHQTFALYDVKNTTEHSNDAQFVTKVADYNPLAGETSDETETRLQQSSPLGFTKLNELRSQLFIAALSLNEAMLESAARKLESDFSNIELLIDGRLETNEKSPEHKKLWSRLFLFFPVLSTSLSSAENQFQLMQKSESFGLVMFDEAGQAVNYHVTGLLQRSRQAIFVGDPIQLEPVVSIPHSVDMTIAEDFLPLSRNDEQFKWGDQYLITRNSAQEVADRASRFFAQIGNRSVGIPLLVHRRCTEPMFSIANKIAYDNKMVNASSPLRSKAIPSGWINIAETDIEIGKSGYSNEKEARAAIEVVKHLAQNNPVMLKNDIYIITPFTLMQRELKRQWKSLAKERSNHDWMALVCAGELSDEEFQRFADNNIGTVHAFQGKEASTVILCCAASKVRKKTGGISWVNSKPNLINVAVTRAKHHLFVLGNAADWSSGTISSELQTSGMKYYESYECWCAQEAKDYDSIRHNTTKINSVSKQVFKF